LTTRN